MFAVSSGLNGQTCCVHGFSPAPLSRILRYERNRGLDSPGQYGHQGGAGSRQGLVTLRPRAVCDIPQIGLSASPERRIIRTTARKAEHRYLHTSHSSRFWGNWFRDAPEETAPAPRPQVRVTKSGKKMRTASEFLQESTKLAVRGSIQSILSNRPMQLPRLLTEISHRFPIPPDQMKDLEECVLKELNTPLDPSRPYTRGRAGADGQVVYYFEPSKQQPASSRPVHRTPSLGTQAVSRAHSRSPLSPGSSKQQQTASHDTQETSRNKTRLTLPASLKQQTGSSRTGYQNPPHGIQVSLRSKTKLPIRETSLYKSKIHEIPVLTPNTSTPSGNRTKLPTLQMPSYKSGPNELPILTLEEPASPTAEIQVFQAPERKQVYRKLKSFASWAAVRAQKYRTASQNWNTRSSIPGDLLKTASEIASSLSELADNRTASRLEKTIIPFTELLTDIEAGNLNVQKLMAKMQQATEDLYNHRILIPLGSLERRLEQISHDGLTKSMGRLPVRTFVRRIILQARQDALLSPLKLQVSEFEQNITQLQRGIEDVELKIELENERLKFQRENEELKLRVYHDDLDRSAERLIFLHRSLKDRSGHNNLGPIQQTLLNNLANNIVDCQALLRDFYISLFNRLPRSQRPVSSVEAYDRVWESAPYRVHRMAALMHSFRYYRLMGVMMAEGAEIYLARVRRPGAHLINVRYDYVHEDLREAQEELHRFCFRHLPSQSSKTQVKIRIRRLLKALIANWEFIRLYASYIAGIGVITPQTQGDWALKSVFDPIYSYINYWGSQVKGLEELHGLSRSSLDVYGHIGWFKRDFKLLYRQLEDLWIIVATRYLKKPAQIHQTTYMTQTGPLWNREVALIRQAGFTEMTLCLQNSEQDQVPPPSFRRRDNFARRTRPVVIVDSTRDIESAMRSMSSATVVGIHAEPRKDSSELTIGALTIVSDDKVIVISQFRDRLRAGISIPPFVDLFDFMADGAITKVGFDIGWLRKALTNDFGVVSNGFVDLKDTSIIEEHKLRPSRVSRPTRDFMGSLEDSVAVPHRALMIYRRKCLEAVHPFALDIHEVEPCALGPIVVSGEQHVGIVPVLAPFVPARTRERFNFLKREDVLAQLASNTASAQFAREFVARANGERPTFISLKAYHLRVHFGESLATIRVVLKEASIANAILEAVDRGSLPIDDQEKQYLLAEAEQEGEHPRPPMGKRSRLRQLEHEKDKVAHEKSGRNFIETEGSDIDFSFADPYSDFELELKSSPPPLDDEDLHRDPEDWHPLLAREKEKVPSPQDGLPLLAKTKGIVPASHKDRKGQWIGPESPVLNRRIGQSSSKSTFDSSIPISKVVQDLSAATSDSVQSSHQPIKRRRRKRARRVASSPKALSTTNVSGNARSDNGRERKARVSPSPPSTLPISKVGQELSTATSERIESPHGPIKRRGRIRARRVASSPKALSTADISGRARPDNGIELKAVVSPSSSVRLVPGLKIQKIKMREKVEVRTVAKSTKRKQSKRKASSDPYAGLNAT